MFTQTLCINGMYDAKSNTYICNENYYGELCEYFECNGINKTKPFVCSGRGTCIAHDTCLCETNYFGNNCETYSCYGINNDQTSLVCNGRGNCVGHNNCSCEYGFTGQQCENFYCGDYLQYESNACNGHGICTGYDKCECNIHYYGKECEITECFGIFSNETSNVCSGNGDCINYNSCNCKYGYSGLHCETPTCNSISTNGNCIDVDTYECDENYTGYNCEIPLCFGIDARHPSVCNGRGTCNDVNTCTCENKTIVTENVTIHVSSYGDQCQYTNLESENNTNSSSVNQTNMVYLIPPIETLDGSSFIPVEFIKPFLMNTISSEYRYFNSSSELTNLLIGNGISIKNETIVENNSINNNNTILHSQEIFSTGSPGYNCIVNGSLNDQNGIQHHKFKSLSDALDFCACTKIFQSIILLEDSFTQTLTFKKENDTTLYSETLSLKSFQYIEYKEKQSGCNNINNINTINIWIVNNNDVYKERIVNQEKVNYLKIDSINNYNKNHLPVFMDDDASNHIINTNNLILRNIFLNISQTFEFHSDNILMENTMFSTNGGNILLWINNEIKLHNIYAPKSNIIIHGSCNFHIYNSEIGFLDSVEISANNLILPSYTFLYTKVSSIKIWRRFLDFIFKHGIFRDVHRNPISLNNANKNIQIIDTVFQMDSLSEKINNDYWIHILHNETNNGHIIVKDITLNMENYMESIMQSLICIENIFDLNIYHLELKNIQIINYSNRFINGLHLKAVESLNLIWKYLKNHYGMSNLDILPNDGTGFQIIPHNIKLHNPHIKAWIHDIFIEPYVDAQTIIENDNTTLCNGSYPSILNDLSNCYEDLYIYNSLNSGCCFGVTLFNKLYESFSNCKHRKLFLTPEIHPRQGLTINHPLQEIIVPYNQLTIYHDNNSPMEYGTLFGSIRLNTYRLRINNIYFIMDGTNQDADNMNLFKFADNLYMHYIEFKNCKISTYPNLIYKYILRQQNENVHVKKIAYNNCELGKIGGLILNDQKRTHYLNITNSHITFFNQPLIDYTPVHGFSIQNSKFEQIENIQVLENYGAQLTNSTCLMDCKFANNEFQRNILADLDYSIKFTDLDNIGLLDIVYNNVTSEDKLFYQNIGSIPCNQQYLYFMKLNNPAVPGICCKNDTEEICCTGSCEPPRIDIPPYCIVDSTFDINHPDFLWMYFHTLSSAIEFCKSEPIQRIYLSHEILNEPSDLIVTKDIYIGPLWMLGNISAPSSESNMPTIITNQNGMFFDESLLTPSIHIEHIRIMPFYNFDNWITGTVISTSQSIEAIIHGNVNNTKLNNLIIQTIPYYSTSDNIDISINYPFADSIVDLNTQGYLDIDYVKIYGAKKNGIKINGKICDLRHIEARFILGGNFIYIQNGYRVLLNSITCTHYCGFFVSFSRFLIDIGFNENPMSTELAKFDCTDVTLQIPPSQQPFCLEAISNGYVTGFYFHGLNLAAGSNPSNIEVFNVKNNVVDGYFVSTRFIGISNSIMTLNEPPGHTPLLLDSKRSMRELAVLNNEQLQSKANGFDIMNNEFQLDYISPIFCNDLCLPDVSSYCMVSQSLYDSSTFGWGTTHFSSVQDAIANCVIDPLVIHFYPTQTEFSNGYILHDSEPNLVLGHPSKDITLEPGLSGLNVVLNSKIQIPSGVSYYGRKLVLNNIAITKGINEVWTDPLISSNDLYFQEITFNNMRIGPIDPMILLHNGMAIHFPLIHGTKITIDGLQLDTDSFFSTTINNLLQFTYDPSQCGDFIMTNLLVPQSPGVPSSLLKVFNSKHVQFYNNRVEKCGFANIQNNEQSCVYFSECPVITQNSIHKIDSNVIISEPNNGSVIDSRRSDPSGLFFSGIRLDTHIVQSTVDSSYPLPNRLSNIQSNSMTHFGVGIDINNWVLDFLNDPSYNNVSRLPVRTLSIRNPLIDATFNDIVINLKHNEILADPNSYLPYFCTDGCSDNISFLSLSNNFLYIFIIAFILVLFFLWLTCCGGFSYLFNRESEILPRNKKYEAIKFVAKKKKERNEKFKFRRLRNNEFIRNQYKNQ